MTKLMTFAAGVLVALPVAAQDSVAAPPIQTTAITVELVISRDVVDRMPVDTAHAFPADIGKLYAWTRVTGAEGRTIQHVWIFNGEEYPVPLEIGGSPWRVWSSKEIPADAEGTWRVEIRDDAGNVLAGAEIRVGSTATEP